MIKYLEDFIFKLLFKLIIRKRWIEFCKWSKEAEWKDGKAKTAFIHNNWNEYIQLFLNEHPNHDKEP